MPFQRLAVASDGRVFMCTNDEFGCHQVGDARIDSIDRIWNGSRLQEVRKIHMLCKGYDTFASCRDCYQPRKTVIIRYQVDTRLIPLAELVGRPQAIGK